MSNVIPIRTPLNFRKQFENAVGGFHENYFQDFARLNGDERYAAVKDVAQKYFKHKPLGSNAAKLFTFNLYRLFDDWAETTASSNVEQEKIHKSAVKQITEYAATFMQNAYQEGNRWLFTETAFQGLQNG